MDHKTVVITGANGGIGLSITEEFAKAGYDIWACARKKNMAFEERLIQFSRDFHVEIKPVYFDLSDDADIKTGMRQILSEGKDIDILINNAGIAYGGLMTMTPVAKMREIFEVNVFAQIQMMQIISRKMIRQKRGLIINMCSVCGIEHEPGTLAYGSSKAAMIWITKMAANELGVHGIRVNGIAPGLVDTDMGHYKSEREIERTMDRMSIKRMGKPEEIARAALYLSSDDANYMTGQILVLDGGLT